MAKGSNNVSRKPKASEGERMWIQKVAGGGVTALAYAPDGRTLYVAVRDEAVVAWDVVTRNSRRLFDLLAIRRLVLAAERYLVAITPRAVHVLNIADGVEVARQSISNPHDDVLVTSDGLILYQPADRLSLLARRVGDAGEGKAFAGPFPRPVRAYDLSPDGRTVAFACDFSRDVGLFDVAAGSVTARSPLEFDSGLVWGLRFSPDGQTLAVFSGSQLRFCDAHTLAARAGRVNIDNRNGDAACAFHPTAPLFVALNAGGLLTLFRTDTCEPVRSLDFALGRRVHCVAFAPDGLTCAIGGSNKQFAVFDVDV